MSLSLDQVKQKINNQINQYGYFTNGYTREHEIREIIPIIIGEPELLGSAVIIAHSTKEEYHRLWGTNPNGNYYYYRMVKD